MRRLILSENCPNYMQRLLSFSVSVNQNHLPPTSCTLHLYTFSPFCKCKTISKLLSHWCTGPLHAFHFHWWLKATSEQLLVSLYVRSWWSGTALHSQTLFLGLRGLFVAVIRRTFPFCLIKNVLFWLMRIDNYKESPNWGCVPNFMWHWH